LILHDCLFTTIFPLDFTEVCRLGQRKWIRRFFGFYASWTFISFSITMQDLSACFFEILCCWHCANIRRILYYLGWWIAR
jgi:hypothetical protein